MLGFFPEDCVWGPWSTWLSCSKTCGGGTETRLRTKTKAERNGGNCPESGFDIKTCNTQSCPGKQSVCYLLIFQTLFEICCWKREPMKTCTDSFSVDCEFGHWSQCNETCGEGFQKRSIIIEPKFGGKIFDPNASTKKCFIKECPKKGIYSCK